MKRKFRLIFPIIAACFALSGCDFISIKGKGDIKIDDPYYAGYDYTLTGTKLQKELQKLCFAKHVKWVTYGQVGSTYDYADAIEDGSSTKQQFYTAKQSSQYGTREHVWPCAQSGRLWIHDDSAGVHYVDADKYIGGGSDLYHVRSCNSKVNTARGDSRFTDFDDSTSVAYEKRDSVGEYDGGSGGYPIKIQGFEGSISGTPKYADFCEPADQMKGDVARIICYVYVHYGYKNQDFEGQVTSGSLTYKFSDMLGELVLTSVMGYSTNKRCQQVLKEWNEMDPPSSVEKARNNMVQKIQGNRNMFVDYPELINKLF